MLQEDIQIKKNYISKLSRCLIIAALSWKCGTKQQTHLPKDTGIHLPKVKETQERSLKNRQQNDFTYQKLG